MELQALGQLREMVAVLEVQLNDHVAAAKAKCQDHLWEIQVLNGSLTEAEKQIETMKLEILQSQEKDERTCLKIGGEMGLTQQGKHQDRDWDEWIR